MWYNFCSGYRRALHDDDSGKCMMSNTKIWAISILGIICVWFAAISTASLMPVIWAAFLAFFIHPLVLWVQKSLKLRRKIFAILFVLLIIVALIIILINSVLPGIINQLLSFGREFTGYSMRFMRAVDDLRHYLVEMGLDNRITSQVDDALSQIFTALSDFIMSVVSLAFGYIFRLTDLVVTILALFYFLSDGPEMVSFFIEHMPGKLKEAVRNFVQGISGIIWKYMKNQVIISAITGVACGIAFVILKLPFAGLLGIMAAVLNMIPIFGSIISGVVASFVTMFYFNISKALITALVVLGINVILGNIITPMLQGRTLGMHPVAVIVSLLVCNYLWGAIGMFIAVPLVGLVRLFWREMSIVINKL